MRTSLSCLAAAGVLALSSPAVAQVCGNGIQEAGEGCDAGAPIWTGTTHCDATTCQLANTFTCGTDRFISYNGSIERWGYDGTNITTSVLTASVGSSINGMGLNPADGFLYAINSTGNVLRVAADGTVADLGCPQETGSIACTSPAVGGSFLPDGTYLINDVTSDKLVHIDVSNPVAPEVTLEVTDVVLDTFDTATNPIDGQVYYFDNTANQLGRLDPTTGVQTLFGAVAPETEIAWAGGAMFVADGTLYLFNGGSATGAGPATQSANYVADTATGVITFIGNATGTEGAGSDSASCPEPAAAPDSDNDGISDPAEALLGTDPEDADTDNDGIDDGDEVNATGPLDGLAPTNPLDADSDDDGLPDGAELAADTPTNPNNADTDDDGLPDGLEAGVDAPVMGGDSGGPAEVPFEGTDTDSPSWIPDADPDTTTDPTDADSDDDGLEDGDEDANTDGAVDGPVIGATGTAGSGETDPNDEDTDDDGLNDGPEVTVHNTDPLDVDSDDGGVGDGVEVNDDATDPTVGADDIVPADTDEDGLSDAVELLLGTDPDDSDTDNDGIDDGAEVAGGDPNVYDDGTDSDPLDADTDDDGISDGDELAGSGPLAGFGPTDPLNPDSDDDGLHDGLEAGVADGLGDGTSDGAAGVSFRGTASSFVGDQDPTTTTDPTDDDSDDDGLIDGNEDTDGNGQVDATLGDTGSAGSGETDPDDADTDNDGLQDGTERGLDAPQGDDTNLTIFVVDGDTSTQTDPLDPDTDDGGVADGTEDSNQNGAVDDGERDPEVGADDSTGGGSDDVLASGGSTCSGGGGTSFPLVLVLALGLAIRLRGRYEV